MADERLWFERAELWEVLRRIVFPPGRVAAAAAEVSQLEELLAREAGIALAGARVLDMPCGVGRHACELARRGAHVTGVDLTEAFVAHTRALAETEALAVDVVQGDMRTYRGVTGCDVALSLFSSLGYSNDRADDVETLRRFREALRPGGALVIDTMALGVLARVYQPVRFHEVDGWVVEERSTVSNALRQVDSTFRMRRDGESHQASFRLRLYSAGELITMLEEAGFASTKAFGTLGGSAYDLNASRLVLLARTPDAP